jgi:hypothetical protein
MAGKGHAIDERVGVPPRWAEIALERILTDADGQAVTGDLREEYTVLMLLSLGRAGRRPLAAGVGGPH